MAEALEGPLGSGDLEAALRAARRRAGPGAPQSARVQAKHSPQAERRRRFDCAGAVDMGYSREAQMDGPADAPAEADVIFSEAEAGGPRPG